MNEQQIMVEVERRIEERRKTVDEYMGATLTTEDIKELKKLATASRFGKWLAAGFIALGGTVLAVLEIYLQLKHS